MSYIYFITFTTNSQDNYHSEIYLCNSLVLLKIGRGARGYSKELTIFMHSWWTKNIRYKEDFLDRN